MKFKIALFCVIVALVTFVGCYKGGKCGGSCSVERSPAITDNRAVIAIIDSGIESDTYFDKYLCSEGHKDYTGTGLKDTVWHGTAIAKLITYGMNPDTQCLLILKYYTPTGANNLINELHALEYVKTLDKVKYLNFSSGGDIYSDKEDKLIVKLLDKDIKVIVSAGNGGKDLTNPNCTYFPACNKYSKNFYVVSSCDLTGTHHKFSNYGGPAKQCRDSMRVKVNGRYISGTSVSTAIFTSELIKQGN